MTALYKDFLENRLFIDFESILILPDYENHAISKQIVF